MTRLTSSLILKNPVVVVYLLGIILFSLGLLLTYRVRPFISDDVFWQVILKNGWRPFNGTDVTLGNSSIHIDKLILYWLTGHIGLSGRKALLIDCLGLGLASFSAFYWGSVYLLKNLLGKIRLSYASLVPFLWVAAGLGYSFFALYLDPDWRGFQICFAFVLLALTYAFWHGRITFGSIHAKVILFFLAIYTGLLIYGDPYLLYFAIAPLVLFTVISYYPLRKITRRMAIITLLAIIATYIFSKIFAAIGSAAGVDIALHSPITIVAFSQLGGNIASTIQSLLTIAGADFFGFSVNRHLLFPGVNFIVLATALYATYRVTRLKLKDRKKDSTTTWVLFLISLLAITVIFYILTTLNGGTSTYRYLLFTILLIATIFSYFMSSIESKKVTYIIVGVTLLSVIVSLSHIARASINNQANQDNYQLIDILEKTGYTRGYAGYFDANINSYLSNGRLQILPTICSPTRIAQWPFLINNTPYHTQVSKSFYIYDSVASGLGSPCTPQMLFNQAGKPVETIQDNKLTIYLYNYDLVTKF